MNFSPLVLDIARARHFELAVPVAGQYGPPVQVKLDRGLYGVYAADVVGLRFSSGTFRVGSTGQKLEVPVQPLLPLQLLIVGPVSAAARNAACVVWFVPLLAYDIDTGKLVHVGCEAA